MVGTSRAGRRACSCDPRTVLEEPPCEHSTARAAGSSVAMSEGRRFLGAYCPAQGFRQIPAPSVPQTLPQSVQLMHWPAPSKQLVLVPWQTQLPPEHFARTTVQFVLLAPQQ